MLIYNNSMKYTQRLRVLIFRDAVRDYKRSLNMKKDKEKNCDKN